VGNIISLNSKINICTAIPVMAKTRLSFPT